jgi:hypothetical protein
MTQNVRTSDEAVFGSKIFVVIILTFEKDTTNLKGTLVENVKKSKSNPPYCIYQLASTPWSIFV